jgi:ABC-2 type transport system ATP-binding protein
LALAAALLHHPKLLLLDEPTAGVDPEARREFWDHLHSLARKGVTTLVSTHYMDEAERCTRLAYIVYGHILAEGTANEIIERSKLNTWQVSGEDLGTLTELLLKNYGQLQTSAFGQTLHVSGDNNVLLEKAMHEFQTEKWHWTKIPSNLEDIFVYLVRNSERKREKQ